MISVSLVVLLEFRSRYSELSRFNKFYRKYIYPYDPDRYALRFAIKSSGAILVSVLLLSRVPILPVWAALGAWMVSQAKTGETHRFRMAILAITGGIIALLIPIATGLTHTFWPAIIFILAVAFSAFYANVLGPAYGKAGIYILIACAVAIGKPGDWAEGLVRSGGIIIGTIIAFISHFLILPLRPSRILHTRLDIIVDQLGEFLGAVSRGYRDPKRNAGKINSLKQRTLNSLEEFNRLPELLQPAPWTYDSREAAVLAFGLDLNRLFRQIITLWQVRLNGETSAVFKDSLDRLIIIMDHCTNLLKGTLQTLKEGKPRPEGGGIISELDEFDNYLKSLREKEADSQLSQAKDWLPLINAYLSLRTITLVLGEAGETTRLREELNPAYRPGLNLKSIRARITSNFNRRSTAFRLSLQGAATAGIGLAAVKILSPIINLQYGYWVIMFGIISLRPTLGSALKSGRYRIAGTVIGAGMAVIILLAIGSHPIPVVCILVLSLFLMLYLTRLPYQILSLSISTFTFCLLIGLLSGLDWRLGLDRIEDTFIAIAIGLVCSFLIWPNRAGRQLILSLSRGLKSERTFFNSILHDYLAGRGETKRSFHLRRYAEDTLNRIKATYDAAAEESGKNAAATQSIYSIIKYLELILDSLMGLEMIADFKTTSETRRLIDPALIIFRRDASKTFDSLARVLSDSTPIHVFPDLLSSYNTIQAVIRKLKLHQRGMDKLLDIAAIFWHIKALTDELEAIKQPFDHLVSI